MKDRPHHRREMLSLNDVFASAIMRLDKMESDSWATVAVVVISVKNCCFFTLHLQCLAYVVVMTATVTVRVLRRYEVAASNFTKTFSGGVLPNNIYPTAVEHSTLFARLKKLF